MSRIYQSLLKPILFRSEPETVHHRTLSALSYLSQSPALCQMLEDILQTPKLPTQAMGLQFPNPIGLAAGMDKNGVAIDAWSALGFGFTEIGGITQHPQPGNPQPRLFRAPETQAIINRMGFNNDGADTVVKRLQNNKPKRIVPLGVNLGKSKRTPLEEAYLDFADSFQKLWAYADFFVVNVSSPNTPGLRKLQDKDSLRTILETLDAANLELKNKGGSSAQLKPILVKIAPDLSLTAIDDVIDLVLQYKLSGVVATNTTLSRPSEENTKPPHVYNETGGLSGKPLRKLSTEIVRHIAEQTTGKLTIVGVGGIDDAASAWEKITAGATLCQVYSGLVFKGPELIPSIVQGLLDQLKIHGFRSLQEAVGTQISFVNEGTTTPRFAHRKEKSRP